MRKQSCASCFALFPENYNIHMDKLTRYMMGDGFLNDVNSLEDASQRVHVLVDKLKSACLLLDGDSEGFVKMHDVVRDAAISICSKGEHGFLSKVGLELREWPKKVEECKRISLMKNRISKLPDRPECPLLQTLLMQNNWPLTRIPENFFDGMKSLAVLDLNGNPISSLPASLKSLENLGTLCLHKCRKLMDISCVGQLKNLEILRLNLTKISALPEQMGSLVNLKLLDLSNTESLKRVPPNVISKLICLEELYMGRSFSKWEIEGKGNGSNANFRELASLPCLNLLQCRVEDVECSSQHVSRLWRKLNKFCICVNGKYEDGTSQRILRIHLSDQISNWVNFLLGKTEELNLLSCNGVKSLMQLHARGFNDLKSMTLKDSREIEYLIRGVEDEPENVLERLKELNLDGLKNFKEIYSGPLPADFLHNLQVLRIYDCEKLVRIFSSELIYNLHNLERLEVCGCDELKEAFCYDGLLVGQLSLISRLQKLRLKRLPRVSTIWKGEIPVGSLRNVEDLYVGGCKNMKSLFSPLIVQRLEGLKQLEIKTCEVLENLFSTEEGMQQWPAFQNLRKLSIHNCSSITIFFSMKLARNLMQLEELHVESCPAMKTVVAKDDTEVDDQGLLPKLKILVLYRLKALTSFGEGPSLRDLQKLEYLKVWRCQELKRLPIGPNGVLKLVKFEATSKAWLDQLEWEEEAIKSRLHELLEAQGRPLSSYL